MNLLSTIFVDMLKTAFICLIIHCYPEYNITCTPELDFKIKTIPTYDNVTYRVQLNAGWLEGIPWADCCFLTSN